MIDVTNDQQAFAALKELAEAQGIDIGNGKVRRTSSRFCLGVEHGDYNGTELFGVGTDRFIWMAYKPNGTDTVRIFSGNFPDDIGYHTDSCADFNRVAFLKGSGVGSISAYDHDDTGHYESGFIRGKYGR